MVRTIYPNSCKNSQKLYWFEWTEACGDGRVRLVVGDTAMKGRVEVCTTDEWKEVGYCGQMERTASVICNQLGYSRTGKSIIIDDAFYMPIV